MDFISKMRRYRDEGSSKVFCIGYNKTGTRSLHDFFVAAGLTSQHQTTWPFYSDVHERDAKAYFRRARCYSDGEHSNFIRLDQMYPTALFILNTRDETAWLRSRIKHVLRYGMPASATAVDRDPRYGLMARVFFTNERHAITTWILQRRDFEARARRYFLRNARFIELSVTDEADWQVRLKDHLVSHGVIGAGFVVSGTIHANQRDVDTVPAQAALSKYIALADRIRAELDT